MGRKCSQPPALLGRQHLPVSIRNSFHATGITRGGHPPVDNWSGLLLYGVMRHMLFTATQIGGQEKFRKNENFVERMCTLSEAGSHKSKRNQKDDSAPTPCYVTTLTILRFRQPQTTDNPMFFLTDRTVLRFIVLRAVPLAAQGRFSIPVSQKKQGQGRFYPALAIVSLVLTAYCLQRSSSTKPANKSYTETT